MRARLLLPLLLFATAACYSWGSREPSPEPYGSNPTASRTIRVTLVNGKKRELYQAAMIDDTLRGLDRVALDDGRRVHVLIPASRIRRVEYRHVSGVKTLAGLLVLGGLVGFAHGMSNLGPI
jgi:hypothetical protein